MTPEEQLQTLQAEVTELRQSLTVLTQELEKLRAAAAPATTKAVSPNAPGAADANASNRAEIQCCKLTISSPETPVKLVLAADADGVGLALRDGQGVLRGHFHLDDTSAQLELDNAAGETVVVLTESEDGGGNIYAATATGSPCVQARGTEHGGMITIVNAQGEPRVALTAEGQGGKIFVSNAENTYAGVLAADTTGGSLQLHELGGQPMATLAATTETGALILHGPQGERAVMAAGTEAGGVLLLCDVEGEPLKSLP